MAHRRSLIWSGSKDEFIKAMLSSNSMGELLDKFYLENKGSNYKTIAKRCKEDNLEKELEELRFRGKEKQRKACSFISVEIPLDKILVENSSYARGHLKRRLIKEGLLENKCSVCFIEPVWNSRPLVLILDHINGISNYNKIENLRLVCPNCNSQLDTFAGRRIRIIAFCIECGNETTKNRKFCNKCVVGKQQRKREFNISKEELKSDVWKFPMTELSKKYSVSDRLISKRCKEMNIEKPPMGYWAKKENKYQ